MTITHNTDYIRRIAKDYGRNLTQEEITKALDCLAYEALQESKNMAIALRGLLASATPHPEENPAMFAAWTAANQMLEGREARLLEPISLRDIQAATLAARERLEDSGIGTRVKRGKFQIVRVEFDPKGDCTETELSGWMDAVCLIPALQNLTSSKPVTEP
jgi:hypothetical protein